MARAMWKGELQLGKHPVGVKLYSAVEDRSVHFRMLHAKDKAPVEQHIVRKDTGEDVPKEDMRKAYAVDRGTAVILQPEELEQLVPPESRDIEICRFVPASLLGDQWFERPYFLGPDGDDDDYFALAEAIEVKQVLGIGLRSKRSDQLFVPLVLNFSRSLKAPHELQKADRPYGRNKDSAGLQDASNL